MQKTARPRAKQTPAPQPQRHRLIQQYARNAITNDDRPLEDLLMVLAETIENSMLQAGAKPDVDYTYRDLFELANPYALAMFNDPKGKVSFLS